VALAKLYCSLHFAVDVLEWITFVSSSRLLLLFRKVVDYLLEKSIFSYFCIFFL